MGRGARRRSEQGQRVSPKGARLIEIAQVERLAIGQLPRPLLLLLDPSVQVRLRVAGQAFVLRVDVGRRRVGVGGPQARVVRLGLHHVDRAQWPLVVRAHADVVVALRCGEVRRGEQTSEVRGEKR